VNAKTSLLYLHVTAKHDDKAATPTDCFDALGKQKLIIEIPIPYMFM